ncbi:class B sortase [Anaerosphaera aminiphila]|uniref:class B sortase n=1 Tax=Anaerosphaera aminiphila TaxID=1120994 RepID=UPI00093525DC|nr:class B sortase [Anaerosphaera aminiphila]
MEFRSFLGTLLVLFALLVLGINGFNHYREKQLIKELRTKMQIEEMRIDTQMSESKGINPEQSGEGAMLLKFEQLFIENNDLVGWIRIPGTTVDYPVLQFIDNDYYLNKDYHGNKSKAGSVFMDYRNSSDAKGFNTILYAHHMANGFMFGDLIKYKDEKFFIEHPTINFDVLNREWEWEIFSVYVTDVGFYYIDTNFPTKEKKLDFIKSIRERSMFESDVHVGTEDHILTLSTCTYEFDNARFVVHAKRIDHQTSQK